MKTCVRIGLNTRPRTRFVSKKYASHKSWPGASCRSMKTALLGPPLQSPRKLNSLVDVPCQALLMLGCRLGFGAVGFSRGGGVDQKIPHTQSPVCRTPIRNLPGDGLLSHTRQVRTSRNGGPCVSWQIVIQE